MKSYSGGVVVLNLIKQNGKHKIDQKNSKGALNALGIKSEIGEAMIGEEFTRSVEFLKANHFQKRIDYQWYDFHSQKKAKANYLGDIVDLIKKQCSKIGVFSYENLDTDDSERKVFTLQHGVVRVNCIDCLDRTNVGQYCVVRAALPKMLDLIDVSLLGEEISESKPCVSEFDLDESYPDFIKSIRDLFKAHGDHISLQYAGSEAMHSDTLETGSKLASLSLNSSAQSRELSPARSADASKQVVNSLSNAFKAVKRYYANNFVDESRQYAYDVFLGYFIPSRKNGYIIWKEPKQKESSQFQPLGHHQDVDSDMPSNWFVKSSAMNFVEEEESEEQEEQDEEEEASPSEEKLEDDFEMPGLPEDMIAQLQRHMDNGVPLNLMNEDIIVFDQETKEDDYDPFS
jgi:hypothetical protein